MWNNAAALNRMSDLLAVVAGLIVLYSLVRFAIVQPVFAMRELRVGGAATHVTLEQVEAIVQRDLRGTFFTLDLERLRGSFEKMPWVRKVDIRRSWPDRIDVAIEEHQPLARWGNVALVNRHGEVFEAAYDAELPVFVGPAGTSREIAIQYERLLGEFSAIGREPVHVQLSQRRAWRVRLDDGMTLEIGREQVENRLSRFLSAYPRTLAPLNRRIDYVDLRYANGFAARVPELATAKAETTRPRTVRPGA
ncbi:MAG: cell division protein FtsQ/DivIB [Burkholderiales bacterium]